jgi:hypothetical protein
MANEIHADYASGSVLYAVIRNRQGQVWRPAGQAFESWGSGGHTAVDYDIALTDKNGSRYIGSFDADVLPGSYSIQVFRQAGASPADTDTLVCSRKVIWTGTGELTPAKILANKAVQDKVTGAIEYYDDDSQTVLLTLMPYDLASTIARMPE